MLVEGRIGVPESVPFRMPPRARIARDDLIVRPEVAGIVQMRRRGPTRFVHPVRSLERTKVFGIGDVRIVREARGSEDEETVLVLEIDDLAHHGR